MTEPLILAVPSKGRLKEQVEAWLADCGLPLAFGGGARGYLARIDGFDDLQVRLASAAEIAAALAAGDVHLGVTGEDLLRELGTAFGRDAFPIMPLGFGRADLVVAAPQSWVDVESMADLQDVSRLYLGRTGRRLRVATKYRTQTRGFFATHGLADYRVVDSGGATEGAPSAGSAELVVDITSTGATLLANGLRPIADGVILRSQAQLAASPRARWDPAQRETSRRLLRILEARARGRTHAALAWPPDQEARARPAIADFAESSTASGALVPTATLFAALNVLAAAEVGPVTVTRPHYILDRAETAAEALQQALDAPRSRATTS